MNEEERKKKLEALKQRSAKKEGENKGIIRTLFDAPIRFAKFGAEAVGQSARTITDPVFREAVLSQYGMGNLDKFSADELRKFNQSSPTNPEGAMFVDPKVLKDRKSIISEGVKSGVCTAAWLTPVGKGATGIIKGGMLAGGMTGFSGSEGDIFSKEGLQKTTIDTGKGVIVGGTTSGLLHGGGKVLTKGTKKVAGKIYENIIREPSKKLVKRSIRTGKRLGTEVMEAGAGKGLTKQQIYDNAVNNLNSLEDELQTTLAASDGTVSIKAIKDISKDLIKKYADAGDLSAVNNITQRIEALEAQHGDKIPIAVANQVKRTLYDEVRDAAYGQVATSHKEGLKTIARGIKEQIGSKVKGADEINKALSLEGRVADSMEEALTKSSRLGGLRDLTAGGIGFAGGGGPGAAGAVITQRALTSTPAQKIYANVLKGTSNVASKVGKYTGAPIEKAGAIVGGQFGSDFFSSNQLNGQENYSKNGTDNKTIQHEPIIEQPSSESQTAPQETPASQPTQPTNIQGVIDNAAEKYAPGDAEFKKVLHAIAMAESGGNPNAVGDGGNSIGLFQNNMAGGRGAGHRREDLLDPVYNADISAADLVNHYKQGVAQGLSGADLVAYVSRNGQRPAVGNEYQAAGNYGRVAGADKPLAMNEATTQEQFAQFSGATKTQGQPPSNLLADVKGGSPSLNLNETVTITNSQTGEQRTVKRSDLPQYGLPTDYTPQATTQPTTQGALPSKEILDREIQRARLANTKESIDTAENLEKLRDYYYKDESTKKKSQAQMSREELGYSVQQAVDSLIKNDEDVKAGKDIPLKLGLLAGPLESLKAKFNRADPESIAFNILISELQATIAKQRGGTSFTPNEQKLLERYSPKVGDSRQEIVNKLAILSEKMDFFKDIEVENDIQFQGAGFAD